MGKGEGEGEGERVRACSCARIQYCTQFPYQQVPIPTADSSHTHEPGYGFYMHVGVCRC
jgi:hypothetical protein